MDTSQTLDLVLTIIVVSFWVLFPIGMFITMVFLEQNARRGSRRSDPLTQ